MDLWAPPVRAPVHSLDLGDDMQRLPPIGVRDRKEGHIRPRGGGAVDLALFVIIESLSHFRMLFLHCLMHSSIENMQTTMGKSVFIFTLLRIAR